MMVLGGLAWYDLPRGERATSETLQTTGDGQRLFHPEEALASYRRALELARKLAAADPRDAEAQRHLSALHNKLGDVQLQLGDTAQALASYQQGLDISQTLAVADPRDVQAQRELWISFNGLGRVGEKRFDFNAASRQHAEGRKVLQALISLAGRNPFESDLQDLDERIAYCAAGKQAMESLEAALRLPAEKQAEFLKIRIRGLLYRVGRTSAENQPASLAALGEAAKTAEALAALKPPTAENLYNAACGYGLCLGAMDASVDAEQPDEWRATRQQYVERALARLRDAIAAGYKDFDQMRKDADLAPLRDLPAFQQLLPPQRAKPE